MTTIVTTSQLITADFVAQLNTNFDTLDAAIDTLQLGVFSGSVTVATTLAVTGAVTFGSTLAVTGNTTLTGTLAANGGVLGDLNPATTKVPALGSATKVWLAAHVVTAVLYGATSGAVVVAVPAVAGANTVTIPAVTDTLVGKATADVLTNKTLTSPTVNAGTFTGVLTIPTQAITPLAIGHNTQMASTAFVQTLLAATKPVGGLTCGNNAGDATNDLDIAVGSMADTTGVLILKLASAITKQSDANWAVGTNAGGLDTGVVGNSDYYIWLIGRSDTGVVDVLYSLSNTAPTMPASYDFKAGPFGWFKRVAGAIVAFHTYELSGGGIEFKWDNPTKDVNLANTLTTARRTDAIKVPLNFSVMAMIRASIQDATTNAYVRLSCPDETDGAVAANTAPGGSNVSTTAYFPVWEQFIRTSSAGLIAARSSLATVDSYEVYTLGFQWSRR